MSVASHLVGRQIKKMIEAYLNGDWEKALQWHLLLFPVFRGLFIASNPVPLKFLLNQLGFDTGGYRLPLVGPTESEQKALLNLLEAIRGLPADEI